MSPAQPRPRGSIRAKIFGAFVTLGIVTALLGIYGVYSLSKSAAIVADTYDRPLMAINYARAAAFDFAQMENQRLRRRQAAPADRPQIDARTDELTQTFGEDLDVANERALAEDERKVIGEIRDLVAQWGAARQRDAAVTDTIDDRLGGQVADRFDTLTELLADHSFIERRKSVTAVSVFERVGIAATALVLLLAEGVTIYLGRRIIRPLDAAVGVANRIAAGELQAPIPRGGADETGVLLNSMTVMQDNIRIMMEREQAQKESAERRLIDAVESSREAMLLVDARGRIVLANSQFAQFFPTVAELLAERADSAAVGRQITAGLIRSAREAGVDADLLETGGEGRLADGRWIRISRSATRDGGFFLLLSDVTDIKRREEEYRDAKIAADAANVAKSNFLANMSHELRTPLNAIIGFSEILSGETFGPLGGPNYVGYAKDIHVSGLRLLDIVNSVLELTRSQSGELELATHPLDLREVLDAQARRIRKAGEAADLEIEVRLSEMPLPMYGDERKLATILEKLASNAIKFTGAGGRVTVIAGEADDGHVALIVTDTGIGMASDEIAVALEPFGQVDARFTRRFEGAGLGLPLAKVLAELHGGTLVIDSARGHGTTVTVTFPRCPELELTAATAA